MFSKKLSEKKAQGLAEYIIAVFLLTLFAVGSYDLFSRALSSYYNRIRSARTGIAGMQ